jgi:hypothetical protein
VNRIEIDDVRKENKFRTEAEVEGAEGFDPVRPVGRVEVELREVEDEDRMSGPTAAA